MRRTTFENVAPKLIDLIMIALADKGLGLCAVILRKYIMADLSTLVTSPL